MSATLDLYSLTLAHGDTVSSSSPSLRFVDWKRTLRGIPIQNPRSERLTIPTGAEVVVFDGTRSTSIDGTTAFNLTASTLSPDTYRLTHVGGTAPAFRVARSLNLTAIALTLTAQTNGSLLVAAASGTPFTVLQVGDEVFIPGMLTGDGSTPFNGINQGLWVVLGQNGNSVTLARQAGQCFQGLSEVVTPTAAGQFTAFGATGVQVGDKLDVSGGFATPVQKMFEVVTVTSSWVEIRSSEPLALESGVVPGASSLRFFSAAKRFIRVEVDQEATIRLNGDTGSSVRVSPWMAGDPEQVGEFTKVGPTWALSILNRSAQPLRATLISAE